MELGPGPNLFKCNGFELIRKDYMGDEFRMLGYYWYLTFDSDEDVATAMREMKDICPFHNPDVPLAREGYDQGVIEFLALVYNGLRGHATFPLQGHPPLHLMKFDKKIVLEQCEVYYNGDAGNYPSHSNPNLEPFSSFTTWLGSLLPDFALGVLPLWCLLQHVFWLQRAEHVKAKIVDITEPRSWPDYFRNEFLQAYARCSVDFPENKPENAQPTYVKLLRDLNYRKEKPGDHPPTEPPEPFAVEIDYNKIYLPIGLPAIRFEKKDVMRAVHQFQKWGFIRGEAAKEWIEIDGLQLDLAENIWPGAEQEALKANKERMLEHDDIAGFGRGPISDELGYL